jgi:hypothetical protein
MPNGFKDLSTATPPYGPNESLFVLDLIPIYLNCVCRLWCGRGRMSFGVWRKRHRVQMLQQRKVIT